MLPEARGEVTIGAQRDLPELDGRLRSRSSSFVGGHHGYGIGIRLQVVRDAVQRTGWWRVLFDLLHCARCGKAASVGHQELGDIHLRFVKGLKTPYALARAQMDRRIQREYPGEPLSRDGYHAAAEATLDPCPCGGRFSYAAPSRCPTCASTSEMWDETGPTMFYD